MLHSLAAHNLANTPIDGVSSPHRLADRRDERMSSRRPKAPRLSSYLTAMTIAAGLLVAWAGICWI